ncbi:MAG: hypothetical protein JW843_00055 [Candidatus Aminicenantes bacterium]|nr:hypothetical protein [Candidatus Aminicenantes bacterium]
MSKRTLLPAGVVLLALALSPPGASAQGQNQPVRILVGAGGGYLSHSISWDDRTGSSLLNAGYGAVRLGIEFPQKASIALLAGFGGNGWNGLVFRGLPLSVDYQAGAIGAIFLGAELELPLARFGNWEVGLGGQYLFSIGSTGNWTLTGLNQVGTFDGRADWMRVQAGPSLTYRGFETFSPYAAVFFDRLWGDFTMNENINPLVGTEQKDIRGQGVVGASLGMIIEPGTSFRLKAEGSLIPFTRIEGGLALSAGLSLQAIVLF